MIFIYWSDYMILNNPAVYSKSSEFAFGKEVQNFDGLELGHIQDFIRRYDSNPLINLRKVVKDNNVATGYPVWQFHCELEDDDPQT